MHSITLEPLITLPEKSENEIEALGSDSKGIYINWKNKHKSVFLNGWLRSHTCELLTNVRNKLELWEYAETVALPEYNYSDLSDRGVFYEALLDLRKKGIVLFKNVPPKDGEIVKFANKIGIARETYAGIFFNVFSKKNPNSNAYTSLKLYPHTDFSHHETVPGYQLFHYLDNDANGGDSIFVDGFMICKLIKERYIDIFNQLCRPIYTFRFQDNNFDHSYRGSVIELDHDGEVRKIRMNVNNLTPIIASVTEVRSARKSLSKFISYIDDKKYQFIKRMERGDLIINDNHRILHGRTAYDTDVGGTRHLQGCYLDRGDVMSRIQVLGRGLQDSEGCVFDDSGRFILQTKV